MDNIEDLNITGKVIRIEILDNGKYNTYIEKTKGIINVIPLKTKLELNKTYNVKASVLYSKNKYEFVDEPVVTECEDNL